MASTLTAVLAALVALCAALWANYDAVKTALSSLRSDSASPASNAAAKLDYEALRQYSQVASADALRWGTYRSGLYHGIRSRTHPYYVSAGLLWGSTHEDVSQLRHECRQEDRLQKYGWLQHDGRRYGWQSIEDQFNRVELHTYYTRLQSSNGWASRFSAVPLQPRDERLRKRVVDSTKLSLFFYVDLGCGDESLTESCRKKLQNLMDVTTEPQEVKCPGDDKGDFACSTVSFQSERPENSNELDELFDFQIKAQLRVRSGVGGGVRTAELRYAGLKDTNILNVKDRLVSLAVRDQTQDPEITLDNLIEEESTMLVIQATIEFDALDANIQHGDVVLDVGFQETTGELVGFSPTSTIEALISEYKSAFETKFEETFQLASAKGFNTSQVAFAQAAFSNLIGGLSYFYGSSLVQHDPEDPSSVDESPRKALFTAVPSRSFFPRGFLWDEGFHQLGIQRFDREISKDVLAHWLGVMEETGYIPREQILGQTSRRRVPGEFLVQHVEHANPPTLLLTLEKLVEDGDTDYIKLVFPFLQRWYDWFVETQAGPVTRPEIAALRWRGRRPNDGKLIANTLSSGLDDYPRSSKPSELEMHLDLLCWLIKASEILEQLGSRVGVPELELLEFRTNRNRFLQALEEIHWSEELRGYFDVGEHSADGHIEQHVVVRCRNEETGQTADTTASYEQLQRQEVQCPASHPKYLFPLGDGQGGLKMQPVYVDGSAPTLQHVHHIGYVSLFPLLLQVLSPDSDRLEPLLHQLGDPNHLWSPFGLRSMSTQDLFYEQENAHGDNPYWRGSIWINLNYLAIKALHHYGSVAGPYQSLASELYGALRQNVVSTIYSEYQRTGFLWEQYSGNVDADAQYGKGQRCHPFSGWTALVVNIMAEKY